MQDRSQPDPERAFMAKSADDAAIHALAHFTSVFSRGLGEVASLIAQADGRDRYTAEDVAKAAEQLTTVGR